MEDAAIDCLRRCRNCRSGKRVSGVDDQNQWGDRSAYVSLESAYYQQLFHNQEYKIIHNPYNQEKRVLEAIERGDPEAAKKAIDEDYSAYVGILSDDPIRHEKNIGIVNVTTASRAAIHGGLHYEKAYTLSDCCIRQMELCDDIAEIRMLYKAVQLQYAELVRDAKSQRDPGAYQDNQYIELCKGYIFSHLHEKITVQQIASCIGLTPNYLSTLFRKYEHISVKQYILNEKIRIVQKMLIYSPYSYIEIANYLGFSSQSHMGAGFKRVTGMTLRKYREKYQKTEPHEIQ